MTNYKVVLEEQEEDMDPKTVNWILNLSLRSNDEEVQEEAGEILWECADGILSKGGEEGLFPEYLQSGKAKLPINCRAGIAHAAVKQLLTEPAVESESGICPSFTALA